MPDNTEQKQLTIQPEPLGAVRFLSEVIQGLGLIVGMALLWGLELVRNVFFRLLDRFNFKPRPRTRVSAFPPGSPRPRNPA